MNTHDTQHAVGLIGLGRMGMAMAERLLEKGYQVVATDVDEAARSAAAEHGADAYASVAELAEHLPAGSPVWLMVPAQFVDDVLGELQDVVPAGTTIIDGGNSDYRESRRRHERLSESGLHFIDCGTSGGVEGARHGASLMAGGRADVFAEHEHLFATLATKNGYALVGGPGAGHFVKAVHNGIEYGMMGAMAEGIALLHEHEDEFGIELDEVFKPYEHGSIISSRLLSWLIAGKQKGLLAEVSGEVPVGETEAKMQYLTSLGSLPVLEAALAQRKQTRVEPSKTGQYIAIMRAEFGGHATLPAEDDAK